MNYEEFYQNATVLEKGIKDRQASGLKYFKSLCKNSEKGDLKSYAKDLAQLQASVVEQTELLAQLKDITEAFDMRAYVDSGDFAEQMVYECRALSVDVKGDFPIYEMFPYKVRIDTENQDIYVDRKKWQCLRPLSFAKDIKAGRDKLMKVNFNAALFANELYTAYSTAVTVKNKKITDAPSDIYISLKDLYQYMTPMQRFRRDYDAQAYAFDLARLFSSDVREVKDGRKFVFGTSRDQKKFIRILDTDGHEHHLATIRFYEGVE